MPTTVETGITQAPDAREAAHLMGVYGDACEGFHCYLPLDERSNRNLLCPSAKKIARPGKQPRLKMHAAHVASQPVEAERPSGQSSS